MTTLTKVILNPNRRQGRKLLANPQAMHAAVLSAFPPDIDESQSRVLWRVDGAEHQRTLYIVGPEKPDGKHIAEQAGWDTRPAQSLDYERFLGALTKGQRWQFELVANPTYAEAQTNRERGKVKAHVTADQQLGWLYQRCQSAGFALAPRVGDGTVAERERDRWSVEEETAIVERRTLDFRKGSGRKNVRIVTARYRGTLEVTDPEALRRTLTMGIGRARAYGCGLLTLARPVVIS